MTVVPLPVMAHAVVFLQRILLKIPKRLLSLVPLNSKLDWDRVVLLQDQM